MSNHQTRSQRRQSRRRHQMHLLMTTVLFSNDDDARGKAEDRLYRFYGSWYRTEQAIQDFASTIDQRTTP